MKGHDSYAISNIPWIEKLPSHWSAVKFKHLFTLAKRPIYDSDKIVTAFRDGEVTLRENRRTTGFTNSVKEIGYQGVRKGDLVVHAMDAFAGAIGVSDSNGKCTPVYSCCVPNEFNNSHYYADVLRVASETGFIQSLSRGIRERSTEFRWNDLAELIVPCPPFDEQDRIEHFLEKQTSRINALISEKQRFITLLLEKRQSIILNILTKGIDEDIERKSSTVRLIGDIPKNWIVCKLKHILKSEKGSIKAGPFGSHLSSGDMKGSDYKVYNQRSVIDNDFISGDLYISEEKYSQLAGFSVEPKDILVTTRGTIGKTAVVPEGVESGIIHPCLIRLKCKSGIDENLIAQIISSSGYFLEQLTILSDATTIDVVYTENLKNAYLTLPPTKEEQREVLQFLKDKLKEIDDLVAETRNSIELLKEHRSALISAAVTGKIDVREEV